MSLHTVQSADGTRIGYELRGAGPALVLVHGATADRSRWDGVVEALAAHRTLYLMDRRGRGLSREEAPGAAYSIACEAEDVRAVVATAAAAQAAPVGLLAHSYGGVAALVAAQGDANVARLMVYEPAFAPPGSAAVPPEALLHLNALLAAGRLDEALEFFFVQLIGVPPAGVAMMKTQPSWQARLAATPPLAREALEVNRGIPAGLERLTMPVRVLVGAVSPDWLRKAAYAAQAAIPGADIVELPGQAHGAMDTAPALFVAEVLGFFRTAA